MKTLSRFFILTLCGGMAIGVASCGSRSDVQETAKRETEAARERARQAGDEVAEAAKNAKPELNKAGEKLGEAARTAVEDAKAAKRGMEEGWNKDAVKPKVDLNTAPEQDLVTLPGIGPREARRIISARPYKYPSETVKRGALSESEYEGIQDRVKT